MIALTLRRAWARAMPHLGKVLVSHRQSPPSDRSLNHEHLGCEVEQCQPRLRQRQCDHRGQQSAAGTLSTGSHNRGGYFPFSYGKKTTMRRDRSVLFSLAFTVLFVAAAGCGDEGQSQPVGLDRVAHIVVMMQENHFDNYFGMLPYVKGDPYHAPPRVGGLCDSSDHRCVDGLTRTPSGDGINCTNFNFECDRITKVFSFHETNYGTSSPAHEWVAAHEEANPGACHAVRFRNYFGFEPRRVERAPSVIEVYQ
jgi:phospholipase C